MMLDEPFTMLEPIYKDLVKEYLLQLKTTKGIIITDHYYRDVMDITTSNFLLKDGCKIEVIEKIDLLNYGFISSE